jgi:hypothetical protein
MNAVPPVLYDACRHPIAETPINYKRRQAAISITNTKSALGLPSTQFERFLGAAKRPEGVGSFAARRRRTESLKIGLIDYGTSTFRFGSSSSIRIYFMCCGYKCNPSSSLPASYAKPSYAIVFDLYVVLNSHLGSNDNILLCEIEKSYPAFPLVSERLLGHLSCWFRIQSPSSINSILSATRTGKGVRDRRQGRQWKFQNINNSKGRQRK